VLPISHLFLFPLPPLEVVASLLQVVLGVVVKLVLLGKSKSKAILYHTGLSTSLLYTRHTLKDARYTTATRNNPQRRVGPPLDFDRGNRDKTINFNCRVQLKLPLSFPFCCTVSRHTYLSTGILYYTLSRHSLILYTYTITPTDGL
jgi:hypothetical protein